jgi:hypothetical protein
LGREADLLDLAGVAAEHPDAGADFDAMDFAETSLDMKSFRPQPLLAADREQGDTAQS